jgi:segregation and condensation protein A
MSEPTPAAVDGFAVELPVFTGPFRVLADLILEQKIDVCDVAIASVTDRFLAQAKASNEWTLEEATWFLAVCAVLLELKVGRLMPRHESGLDEDDLGPSPDLAYARSIELRAFRRVAVDLARRMEDNERYFVRDVGPDEDFKDLYPDVMANVTAEKLAALAASALAPPPILDLSHVTPIRATMAEELRNVEERLGQMGSSSFRDLVADCEDRMFVVVRFLALLELFRDGRVELSQAPTFGEIEVTWQG